MHLIFWVLFFQDFSIERAKSWEDLARPWMTIEETALYDGLNPGERTLFRGVFVSRRLERPYHWPKTGMYLSYFFPVKKHGDIRDLLAQVLGEPDETVPSPRNPNRPLAWRFGEQTFYFEAETGGQLKLAEASQADWDLVKQALVKHPDLRYDFRVKSFGRTRLPEDLTWLETGLAEFWRRPGGNGARTYFKINISPEFKQAVRDAAVSPLQNMEALVLLKTERDESLEMLQKGNGIRHGAQRLNLLDAEAMVFDAHIPPGYYNAEILIYSGYLPIGMRARATLTVLPPELPRISDPILSQEWVPAKPALPDDWVIPVKNSFYRPFSGGLTQKEGRVLIRSEYEDTRVLLQTENGSPTPLPLADREGNWFVFKLDAQPAPFRLLCLGFHERGDQVAFSTRGNPFGQEDASPLKLRQARAQDYLLLSELAVETPGPFTLLSVNGTPVSGSKTGKFAWPSMDWGPTARLRFEYADGNRWKFADQALPRNQVFEQIRVQPQFLVVGVKELGGAITAPEFEVQLDGRPVAIDKKNPLAKTPKLWGIMVNDPLLASPAWPSIRQSLAQWLQKNTLSEDLIYIVHNSARPELVLAPTLNKPMVHAALNALQQKTRNENYFTVRYLIDAITHLDDHQTRPHQVLLLTNRLTDEVQQMQNLIPLLRKTGLQIYNLEFPFEFQPESEAKLADVKPDALTVMGERERQDQRDRIAMRDNFQEQRNVTMGFNYRLGGGKQAQKRKEAEQRAEAFRASFNGELADLTAGLSLMSTADESLPNLAIFFEDLTRWQQNLVHVALPDTDLNEDRVKVIAPEGRVASWTLVQWR